MDAYDERELPSAVYTPESQMRTPGRLIRSMWKDLKGSRELAWRLFVRDLSARYRQSLLGVFWSFVPPVITGLVFIILHSKRIVNFGSTDIPYPVFAMVGTLLWQLFTESLNAPLSTVKAAAPILAKINFPREALIVSAFYQMLFSLSIKVVVIIGVLLVFGMKVTPWIIPSLLIMIALILLGMGIGLLLTPVGMLYSDIASILAVGIQFWFFITPVVYPAPTTFPYSLIAFLNPVSPLLTGARDVMTKGAITHTASFLAVTWLTVVLVVGAWVVYRVTLPIIVERMSS